MTTNTIVEAVQEFQFFFFWNRVQNDIKPE